jgi:hypothetical protein
MALEKKRFGKFIFDRSAWTVWASRKILSSNAKFDPKLSTETELQSYAESLSAPQKNLIILKFAIFREEARSNFLSDANFSVCVNFQWQSFIAVIGRFCGETTFVIVWRLGKISAVFFPAHLLKIFEITPNHNTLEAYLPSRMLNVLFSGGTAHD